MQALRAVGRRTPYTTGRKLAVAAESLQPVISSCRIGLAIEEAADDTGLSESVRAGDLGWQLTEPHSAGYKRMGLSIRTVSLL